MNGSYNQHSNAAASSSNAPLHQNTVASGTGPPLSPDLEVPPRKRGGRGPGKKEKDKPAVSVRWEEADLTDRLLTSIASNPRWAAVFTQAAPDQSRASTGVPKRDLQREIARHLFKDNEKFDLEDTRVVEALAVSVKNKLFKIQTLYTECKTELGPLANLKDETEIPTDPAQAQIWARVKEKFPQFFLARDLMFRVPVPRPSAKKEDPYGKRRESISSPGSSHLAGPSHSVAGPSGLRKPNGRTLSAGEIHYNPSHSLSLAMSAPHPPSSVPPLPSRMPVPPPSTASSSLMPGNSLSTAYHQQRLSLPSTPAYTLGSALIPVANPPPTSSNTAPQEDVHSLHLPHSPTPSPLYYGNYQSFSHPAGSTGENTAEELYSASLRSTKNTSELEINRTSPQFQALAIQHSQQQPRIPIPPHPSPPRETHRSGDFAPPNPFPLHPERTPSVPVAQQMTAFAGASLPTLPLEIERERTQRSRPSSLSPPPLSPPLGQTLASLIGILDERKRKREEEWISLKKRRYEEQRQQRIDRERERRHEREMLRLRIRLARVERGDLSRSPREGASPPEGEGDRDTGEMGYVDFPTGMGDRQEEAFGVGHREEHSRRYASTSAGGRVGEGMGGEEDGEGEVEVDPHTGENHASRPGNGVSSERPSGT